MPGVDPEGLARGEWMRLDRGAVGAETEGRGEWDTNFVCLQTISSVSLRTTDHP